MSRLLFDNFDATDSNLVISVTESADSSVINLSNINSIVLTVSDVNDTAAVNLENIVSAIIAATGGADSVSIISDVDNSFSLSAKEAADRVVMRVRTREETRQSSGIQDLFPLLMKLRKANAVLNATERTDGVFIELTKETNFRARISERADGAVVISDVVQNTKFSASEESDGMIVTYQDIKAFNEYVEKMYSEYEEDIIRMILLAA